MDEKNYDLIGTSSVINSIKRTAETAGASNAAILLYGETGTGKEYLARYLHAKSRRAKKAFVPVNCAGLSSSLLDSTLFGYIKGAFTGADSDRAGVIKRAEAGTLFLDEITDMPLDVQGKLLRFLQDFSYWPLGYVGEPYKADVRVIAATNSDIRQLIAEKKFREDLYYRISDIELTMPPLRERKQDIPALAETIMKDIGAKSDDKAIKIGKEELSILQSYDWPGNVRQLSKFLNRCNIFNAHGSAMRDLLNAEKLNRSTSPVNQSFGVMTLVKAEELAIRAALKANDGVKSRAAQTLGITINTLKSKMASYKI